MGPPGRRGGDEKEVREQLEGTRQERSRQRTRLALPGPARKPWSRVSKEEVRKPNRKLFYPGRPEQDAGVHASVTGVL